MTTFTIAAMAAGAPGVAVAAAPRVIQTCLREARWVVQSATRSRRGTARGTGCRLPVLANERTDIPIPAVFTGTWQITDL